VRAVFTPLVYIGPGPCGYDVRYALCRPLLEHFENIAADLLSVAIYSANLSGELLVLDENSA
jgi:hypothetical protein